MLRIVLVVLLLMAGGVQAGEGGGNAAGNVWEGFKKGMRDIGQTITDATTPTGGNKSNGGKDKSKDKEKEKDKDKGNSD